jgi:thiamine pyrophosphokinase
MESISRDAIERFQHRIVSVSDQNRNDLTKAFKLCLKNGWRDITVVGAAGGREDHTLGNISLLVDFARQLEIIMLTDFGYFLPMIDSGVIECEVGQQVSLFSFDPNLAISAKGLKWPLHNFKINRWWQAALNEAVASQISLTFDGAPLLVFLAYNHTNERERV